MKINIYFHSVSNTVMKKLKNKILKKEIYEIFTSKRCQLEEKISFHTQKRTEMQFHI